ncbi:MAG: rod shape-determining protein MreC [Planctomycetota bacterium]
MLFAIKKSHGMSGKNTHFSNTTLFFTLLIAGLVLFFWPKEDTDKISMLFDAAFQPVLQIGRDIRIDQEQLEVVAKDVVSHDRYAKLWKDYNNLHAQLLMLHAEHEQLSRLRSGLPQLSAEGMRVAKITGTGSNYSRELIINKGTRASVHPGQFVLSEHTTAIIGVVSESAETAAKVRLITDTKQTIRVHIRRSGTNKDTMAMMVGNGTDTCSISMIDRQQDISEGDTVFATAVPGKLSVPLIIGEVTNVQPDDQQPWLWKITVRPAEDMSRLNNVVVIIPDEKLLKRKD